MSSFALVTKTYRGDMDPFLDLCASIERLMPDVHHYVLVDNADWACFDRLTTSQRTIVNCSSLLPELRELELFGRRFWHLSGLRLIRGWIYQQLAKIAFVARMEEDAAIHLDSDVTLLQAITKEHVFEGNKVRLFRSPNGGQLKQQRKWHRLAQSDLGLPVTGYQGFDYIGPGVIWAPAVVRAMLAYLERQSGKSWIGKLSAHFRFSEYIHYGVFCDQVEGPQQSSLQRTQDQSCHTCWGYDLSDPVDTERFVEDLCPHHTSVLIQSNLKLPETTRREILVRIQDRFDFLDCQ